MTTFLNLEQESEPSHLRTFPPSVPEAGTGNPSGFHGDNELSGCTLNTATTTPHLDKARERLKNTWPNKPPPFFFSFFHYLFWGCEEDFCRMPLHFQKNSEKYFLGTPGGVRRPFVRGVKIFVLRYLVGTEAAPLSRQGIFWVFWWPPSPAPFPTFSPFLNISVPSPGTSSSPSGLSWGWPSVAVTSLGPCRDLGVQLRRGSSQALPAPEFSEMRNARHKNLPRRVRMRNRWFANKNPFSSLLCLPCFVYPWKSSQMKHKQGENNCRRLQAGAAERWQIYFWWDVLSKGSNLTLGLSPADPGNNFLAGNTTRLLWGVKLNICVHF